MGEWREYKLSELCTLIGGGTPKTTVPEYWNGNIPWLSVSDFNNGQKYCFDAEKKITEKGLHQSSTKILKKGQIIISARGTVGVISVLGRDMAFNQSNYGIDADPSKTTNEFLYYLLKDNITQFISNSYGAVFDTITKQTFDQIIVELPPLSEQTAIAEVLSSLDDKIDLLHRQNKTLEQIAETLFRQWFVEEAEEGWEERTVGDEFDYIMGQSPAGDTLNDTKDGIPFYQGRSDFGFRFPERRMYTTSPTRIANSFDVLISVRAPVGDMNVALEDCCIGRGVAAFRYKFNSKYYTYTYYKLRTLKEKIKSFEDNGTVFGSIGKEDIKKIESIIPPSNIISEYQNMAKPIDEKIILNTHQIRTLTQLRDTLLPKLMSGEVRVV